MRRYLPRSSTDQVYRLPAASDLHVPVSRASTGGAAPGPVPVNRIPSIAIPTTTAARTKEGEAWLASLQASLSSS